MKSKTLFLIVIFLGYFFKDCYAQNYNQPLRKELSAIFDKDQQYRTLIVEKKYHNTKQLDSLWTLQDEADSINLLKVERILEEYGWPSKNLVGTGKPNMAIYIVLQHSPPAILKKYLPMAIQAVKTGGIRKMDLVYMIDRDSTYENKFQVYGTQLSKDTVNNTWVFSPIIDPDHVDERRKSVGLEPMEEYAKQSGISWNLEEYKKDLPRLIRLFMVK